MTSGRRLSLILLALAILSLLPIGAYAAGPTIIEGTLQIEWGEPERTSSGLEVYTVSSRDGNMYQLVLNDTQKAQLGYESGVKVKLEASVVQDQSATVQNVVSVQSQISVQSGDLQSRPRRYLNILCASPGTKKFPYPPSRYQSLMLKESDFWYQTAGVTFEAVTTEWVFASKAISTYLTLDPKSGWWVPNFQALSNDCSQAAANKIGDPTGYDGINFFFAQDIGCCAWGGGVTVTINGVTKSFSATWMPPWSWILAGLAHELGHSLGLPHSAGSDGGTYTNRFDLMSDLWTDCSKATDPKWGCLPEGTIYEHLIKLNALDANRFTTISTDKQTVTTVFLASLYRPAADLPSEYVYGVNIDEMKYGGKFGLTAEYRDNKYDPNHRLPVAKGVVLHERNEFGRPEPDHLIVPKDGLVWNVGAKFTFSFATVCVLKETEFGVQISVGVNGADCANPPPPVVGKATGFVLHDLAIVVTENIDTATLPSEITVGIYRMEGAAEKLLAVTTLKITPYQENQYLGAWDKCDKEGDYFLRGSVGEVNITSSPLHLHCSRLFLPIARR